MRFGVNFCYANLIPCGLRNFPISFSSWAKCAVQGSVSIVNWEHYNWLLSVLLHDHLTLMTRQARHFFRTTWLRHSSPLSESTSHRLIIDALRLLVVNDLTKFAQLLQTAWRVDKPEARSRSFVELALAIDTGNQQAAFYLNLRISRCSSLSN